MSGCVAVSVTRNKALDGGGARISSDCYLVHVMSLAALTPTSLPASLTTTCKLLDAGGARIADGEGVAGVAAHARWKSCVGEAAWRRGSGGNGAHCAEDDRLLRRRPVAPGSSVTTSCQPHSRE